MPWPLVDCNECALCNEAETMLPFPVLTVITSLELASLKHLNYVCLSIFVVCYGLSKIKLGFDVQYKIVILTYLLTYLAALALKMLASNPYRTDPDLLTF